MEYVNPVLTGDFSNPDVIRVGKDFYMVASSANFAPSVPVYHSENLIEWRLINYIAYEIPFEGYGAVRHGKGAGAPSLRYRDGKFYCLIPFADEGIFVSETDDVYGEWSPLKPLVEGEGIKDPCPIWSGGSCYVVFALAGGAEGGGSRLAVFKADESLSEADGKFTVIYDGRNNAPLISNPKIYKKGKYFYILAAAGGSKSGWQIQLRSPNIYGPYESKIVLMQGDTQVNGPNCGALVDVDEESWAFLHSQDRGAYGGALHVQPVIWRGEWALCGDIYEGNPSALPAFGGQYPVDIQTDYCLDPSDEFDGESISPLWQNPANPDPSWCEIKKGFKLNCAYYGGNALSDLPQMFLQNVPYLNFSVKTKCRLNLVNDGDEVGFTVFGREYAYICVVRREGQNYLEIRKGTVGVAWDETLCQSQPYDDKYVTFQTSAKYEDRHKLTYKFTFGGSAFTHKFYASACAGTGAKIGIYARSDTQSKGFGTFKFFRVVCTDNRVSKNT